MSWLSRLFGRDAGGRLVITAPHTGLEDAALADRQRAFLQSTTKALGDVWQAAERELERIHPGATLRVTSHVDANGDPTGHLALFINTGRGEHCC